MIVRFRITRDSRCLGGLDAGDVYEQPLFRVEATQAPGVTSNPETNNQPLYLLVSNTAPAHGLEQPRTRMNGPNGVDVTVQNASFDALMSWLVALHDMYGVDVETVSITNAREPGLVNGNLLLRR